jgi:hypothetical protein
MNSICKGATNPPAVEIPTLAEIVFTPTTSIPKILSFAGSVERG